MKLAPSKLYAFLNDPTVNPEEPITFIAQSEGDVTFLNATGIHPYDVYSVYEAMSIIYSRTHENAPYYKALQAFMDQHSMMPVATLAYRTGVMDAFCEVVARGVKRIAFSHATDDVTLFTHDVRYAYALTKYYNIHYYVETDMIQTKLFKNSGQHVVLLYKHLSDLEAYLDLKNEKDEQKQARAYGHLLSYSDEAIDELLGI